MSEAPDNFASLGPAWNDFPVMIFAGQRDTHIHTGEDYDTASLGSLFIMEPGDKPKEASPAFIPSSYHNYDGREHAAQREHGSFVALCGDVDKGDIPLQRIEALTRGFAGDAAWLIYSSAHSRPGDRRWRVILPLAAPLPFAGWHDAQHAFFAFMEFSGVAMDRALDRAGQPVYLPNVPAEHVKSGQALRSDRGEPLYFQRSTSGSNAPGLDPTAGTVSAWLATLRRHREEDETERQRIRKEAEARRARQPASDGGNVMADFNQASSLANLLELYGYERSPRHADDWRSPHQTGETYATRIIGDKWISLSGSDAAARVGEQCKAGCFGDAYDLFVHYEHKGDHKAAHRALHAERKASATRTAGDYIPESGEDADYDQDGDLIRADMGDYGDDDLIPVALPDVQAAQEGPEPDGDTFEFLTLGELRQLPPPDWLVHDAVVSDGLTILYGEPGAGKSFIALDIAVRIAMGWDWHGLKTKPVGVLYIAGEGVRGIGKRVAGWALHHKTDIDAIPLVVMPIAAQLLEAGERAKLIRTIDEVKRKLSFEVGLTIVDTVSRSIAGSDENGQETMSAFVKGCDEIKAHTGGAMIGIHHSGKDKERGMRGSTVLLGACDAAIRLSKEEGVVTLEFEKQKDAEEQRPLFFDLVKHSWSAGVYGEEGDELSTLVPMRRTAPSETSLGMDVIAQAFGIMVDAWTDGKPLSNKPQTRDAGRYAPAIFARKFGGDAKVWKDHLLAWLETGCVSYEICDRKAKVFGLRVINPII